ncbi:MAG: spermine synthase [Verrucomicrobiota bacterium]|nr:spermine synthase [Verrucomicrobiota bacterium]
MKSRIKLAESVMESGGVMGLYTHDGAFAINFNGQELMDSRAHASECLLGTLGMERIRSSQEAHVLVGGLGLGFTLRSVLQAGGPKSRIRVVELIKDVVEWNRTHLKDLNGTLLDDPRVTTTVGDVSFLMRDAAPRSHDVILLDVDNGPMALVDACNASLYSRQGLRLIQRVLTNNGRAVFWSASPDRAFESRLSHAGFRVKAVPAKRYPGAKRAACMLYVADQAVSPETEQ